MSNSKGKLKRRSKGANESSFSDSASPERGKVKTKMVREETFLDKLMKKADNLRDKLEYDLAAQFYKRVIECDPEHLPAIESAAASYLQLDDDESAQKYLLQALRLSPEKGFAKYFALGQMCRGHEAVDYFKKGLQVMDSDEQCPPSPPSRLEGCEEGRTRDMSMAYCAIVEIYMTDLCDEEDAETQCKNYIDLAISSDETYPEAYLCAASFHLVKDEHEEAKRSVEKSLSLWFQAYKESREQKNEDCPVSYDGRVNTSKLLIELNMFDEAVEILDGLLEEDDRVMIVWYLLGLLNYLRGKDYYGNARFYLQKGIKASKNYHIYDLEREEQVNHMEQMLSEMGPDSDDEDEDKENKEEDNEDDDEYETMSEEEEMEA